METLWQDLRSGFRMLVSKPGFAIITTLTLMLGVGATISIFSVVNGILFRPLPYKDPDKIAAIWQNNTKIGVKYDDVAPGNFLDWRERNQSFEEMASATPFGFDIELQGEPQNLKAWLVSDGFFQILGTSALIGRTFLPEDCQPGREHVVLMSHSMWQRQFGADRNLVGQKLLLDGEPYDIVGILPPEFKFPTEREVWVPKVFNEKDRQERGSTILNVIARLKPGTTIKQAQDEMTGIGLQIAQEYPQTNTDVDVAVVSLPDQLLGSVRPVRSKLKCPLFVASEMSGLIDSHIQFLNGLLSSIRDASPSFLLSFVSL